MDVNLAQYLQFLNIYKKAFFDIDEDRKEDLKSSIKTVFDRLPDCSLAMIISDNQTSWTSQGNITTEQKRLTTLYKKGNTFSRYEDGSGEVDPLLFLLYNSGQIYTKEEAKMILDPSTTVHTREVINISKNTGISRSRTYKL